MGTEQQNYTNLSNLREYLQRTMKDFTDNKSSYIDSAGKVVSNDYPDLSAEAQGWLDSEVSYKYLKLEIQHTSKNGSTARLGGFNFVR